MRVVSQYIFTVLLAAVFSVGPALAQSDLDKAPKPSSPQEAKPSRERIVSGKQDKKDAQKNPAPITDADRQGLRREDQSEEEAAILPYINNFFATTRLGPEDVISVDVFDQPNYSRANLIVPPNGRISYPLIGQIIVAGRTTEDLEKEITEKLAEYIREPKVSVQMVQVHSLKYLVIGDVTTPGIYEMTRRLTVTEALAKAGYVTRFGELSKVAVLRMQKDGSALPIPINMKEVERGKLQDIYLTPGDTVVVPGNKLKTVDKVMSLVTLSYWMRTIAR